MFGGAYRGTRVLVTGHTGFKGAWLTRWLLDLGAEVTGVALPPEADPSLFETLGLRHRIRHHELDLRDEEGLVCLLREAAPEVVFHLAAQALVRRSYREPKATWDINVGGTVNLLEGLRSTESVRACVVVTSDKCYENREQIWGYRECDPLGGHDPYSSSKGAAELAVASWRQSFFQELGTPRVATARAGNVIGGGHRADDRLVVDFVRAIEAGVPLRLRQPSAVRPWQHVLEPLSGYLDLAAQLLGPGGQTFAAAWNFGPGNGNLVTVEALARGLVAAWGEGTVELDPVVNHPHEAGLLSLDVSKARLRLGWQGLWDLPATLDRVAAWYRGVGRGESAEAWTASQITAYQDAGRNARMPWAR